MISDGNSPTVVSSKKVIEHGKKIRDGLLKMTGDPMGHNEELLMKILRDNENTEYGRAHGFAEIKTIDDYRKRVPLSVYDDYAGMVIDELENGKSNLRSVYGVHHYNKSSGSMGNPKKIPMSEKSWDLFMNYVNEYRYALAAEEVGDDIAYGKALSVIESSSVTYLKDKFRYCGISANMNMTFNGSLPEMFTSPLEAVIPDPETNARYLHARYGLAEKNVTSIQTTFMTFILDLFHFIENNWGLLCDDIEKGTIDASIRMPKDVRKKLESELKPMPERAAELRKIFRQGFSSEIGKKIWPDLGFMSGVSTGTFTAYLKQIRDRYVGDIPVFMIGLVASEGIFTVPFELDNPNFIPIPDAMFYEFLPLDEEDGTKTKTLGEVEVGKDYEIVATTFSGFYRYRMRDAVRITGMYNNIPTMEYLYRIDLCVNLNGEKTYEPALRKTVDDASKELGFAYTDFCVYPNTDETPSCYTFYIEMTQRPDDLSKAELAKCLQSKLIVANPMMVYKFERNLCGPVQAYVLQEETYLLYRDKMILRGGASTQVKPVKIITNNEQLRFFNVLRDNSVE